MHVSLMLKKRWIELRSSLTSYTESAPPIRPVQVRKRGRPPKNASAAMTTKYELDWKVTEDTVSSKTTQTLSESSETRLEIE